MRLPRIPLERLVHSERFLTELSPLGFPFTFGEADALDVPMERLEVVPGARERSAPDGCALLRRLWVVARVGRSEWVQRLGIPYKMKQAVDRGCSGCERQDGHSYECPGARRGSSGSLSTGVKGCGVTAGLPSIEAVKVGSRTVAAKGEWTGRDGISGGDACASPFFNIDSRGSRADSRIFELREA
ncbi:MAG: hypothetical protein QM784_34905 [Polyangiaceae bacterium]